MSTDRGWGYMARNYTKAQVLEAVKGSRGIMTYVARKLQCDWSTAERYVKRYKETEQAFKDEMETVLDKAEQVLFERLNANDEQTAKWLLSKKAKHRGYGDSIEIRKDNEPLNITLENMCRAELIEADNVEIGEFDDEETTEE